MSLLAPGAPMETRSSKIRAGLLATKAAATCALGDTKSSAPIGAGAASQDAIPRGAPSKASNASVRATSPTCFRSKTR
jgi:hypothetical protein